MSYGFDELSDLEESKSARNPRPFWAIDGQGDDEILKWIMGEYNYLHHEATDRVEQIYRNMANLESL